jgi:hypothetical protein
MGLGDLQVWEMKVRVAAAVVGRDAAGESVFRRFDLEKGTFPCPLVCRFYRGSKE